MMDNGLMIKHLGTEYIIIITVPSIKASGMMISSMVMGSRTGWMAANTRGTMTWAKRVARGNTHGRTIVTMTETGSITK